MSYAKMLKKKAGIEPPLEHKNTEKDLSEPLTLVPITWKTMDTQLRKLHRHHLSDLFTMMAVVYGPYIVATLTTVILVSFMPSMVEKLTMILTYGLLPFSTIGYVLSQAFVAKFISELFSDLQPKLWDVLEFVWSKIGTLMHLAIVMSGIYIIALIGGFVGHAYLMRMLADFGVGGILPSAVFGIIIYICVACVLSNYAFVPIIPILEEHKDFLTTADRSSNLAYPSKKTLFRLTMYVFGMAGIISLGGTLLANSFSRQMVTLAVSMGFSLQIVQVTIPAVMKMVQAMLLGPALAAIPVFMYFDHRMKLEGLTSDQLLSVPKETLNNESAPSGETPL